MRIAVSALVFALCFVYGGLAAGGESATATPLTEEAARRIAVGKLEGARVVKSESRTYHNGGKRYTYVLVNSDSRAKVVLDGDSGEVMKFVRWPNKKGGGRRFVDDEAAGGEGISMADAREIALERVGGGEVVKIEKDFEDGGVVYEVELIFDGSEYELEVDGVSGEVVKYETKRLDGDKLRKWEKRRR